MKEVTETNAEKVVFGNKSAGLREELDGIINDPVLGRQFMALLNSSLLGTIKEFIQEEYGNHGLVVLNDMMKRNAAQQLNFGARF